MIPILHKRDATGFTSYRHGAENGLGRLSECTSCVVTRDINYLQECQFTVPVSAKHYADIVEGNIIAIKVHEEEDVVPFDIYAHDETIDGITTFHARSRFYRLNNLIIRPFVYQPSDGQISYDAYTSLLRDYVQPRSTNYYSYSISTQYASPQLLLTDEVSVDRPVSLREMLINPKSNLNASFDFSRFYWPSSHYIFAYDSIDDVGKKSPVPIRYGVDLTDYTRNYDTSGTFNAVIPYCVNSETGACYTYYNRDTAKYYIVTSGVDVEHTVPVAHDFTEALRELLGVDNIGSAPTQAQFEAVAQPWLDANAVTAPNDNITVAFTPIWETSDYASFHTAQDLNILDRVDVIYGPAGVELKDMRVVKTIYDVLAEKYIELELGTNPQTYGDVVQQIATGDIDAAVPSGIDMGVIDIPYNMAFDSGSNRYTWQTIRAKLVKGSIVNPNY